jgi:hypothetical protein
MAQRIFTAVALLISVVGLAPVFNHDDDQGDQMSL